MIYLLFLTRIFLLLPFFYASKSRRLLFLIDLTPMAPKVVSAPDETHTFNHTILLTVISQTFLCIFRFIMLCLSYWHSLMVRLFI